MGMHHGIVVAAADAEATIAALNKRLPKVKVGEERGSLDTLNLEPYDEGWHLAFGELDGRTYILDTSLVLSADGDAVLAASADLGAVVVGCGEETTSGSYWLFAADNGRLLRAYWNCYTDMREPWSKGEPLSSEGEQPLEHLDGAGLIAALASLGFDYERWSAGNELRELSYEPEEGSMKPGELGNEMNDFRRTVEIPQGQQPKPTVVKRGGGFDLVTTAPPEKKGGLFGFLKRG